MAVKSKSKPPNKSTQPRKKRTTRKTPALTRHHAHPKPPEGYVFVPKGDVYITRKCTILAQDAGQEVQIVQSQKGIRIGLDVPRKVLDRVESEASQTAEKRGEAVRRKDDRDRAKTKVVLRERYPKMPSVDLEKVVNHAFMKGSGRVGRTSGQSVERRASLAVGAHVRHSYTDYDGLLDRREVSREQAREMVWKKVRDVKLAWTGKAAKALLKGGRDE